MPSETPRRRKARGAQSVDAIRDSAVWLFRKVLLYITLDQAKLIAKMQPVHMPRTLPVVLSRQEAARLIATAGNVKHQAVLSVAYGTELRAS